MTAIGYARVSTTDAVLTWRSSLWVRSVVSSVRRRLPVCPRKPTFACAALSDATGQKETTAVSSRQRRYNCRYLSTEYSRKDVAMGQCDSPPSV
jgi:hypothetical protein